MMRLSRSLPLVVGLLVLGLMSWPGVALAQDSTLRELVSTTGNSVYTLWTFSRSLINYALVALLIVVAFANILRLNVDTYSVKKILPGLILAFFFANFSLFFFRLMFDLVGSLNETAFWLLGSQAQGESPIGRIAVLTMENMGGFELGTAAAAGGIAGVVVALGIGANVVGAIVGLLVFIVLLFFPIFAMVAVWLMLNVRFFVLQVFIGLAPMAIMLGAFPMTKNLFSQWLNQTMMWLFLLPVAYFITAAGILVMDIGFSSGGGAASSLFAAVLTYAVGIAAMVAAVTVPFKMGGWIMQGVAKIGKMGLLGTRAGIAGGALALEGKSGLQGKIGKGLAATSGVLYAPERIKAKLEKQRHDAEAFGEAQGARRIGDMRQVENLQDKHIQEIIEKNNLKDMTWDQQADYISEQIIKGKQEEAIAGLSMAYQKGDETFVFDRINARLKAERDAGNTKAVKALEHGLGLNVLRTSYVADHAQARSVAFMAAGGAHFKPTTNAKGEVEYEVDDHSGIASRYRARADNAAAAKGHMNEVETIERDAKTNSVKVKSRQDIEGLAARLSAKKDAQRIPGDAVPEDWFEQGYHSDGTKGNIKRFRQDKLDLLTQEAGAIMTHADRFQGAWRRELRENWATVKDQILAELATIQAKDVGALTVDEIRKEYNLRLTLSALDPSISPDEAKKKAANWGDRAKIANEADPTGTQRDPGNPAQTLGNRLEQVLARLKAEAATPTAPPPGPAHGPVQFHS